MQFCKSCGGVLNLFETNEEQICRSCEKKSPQKQVVASIQEEHDDLADTFITVENKTVMLKAAEGWTLWSGPADKPARLGDILKRARRIYQIRSKRNQPKN